MADSLLFISAFLAAVGSGLMAGLFLSFSHFVMRALGSRPADEGMAAMQAINVKILTPWFLAVFLGTGCLGLGLVVWCVVAGFPPGSVWYVVGGLSYLLGCVGVTIVVNVPLNNRLAASDPATEEGQAFWRHYLRVWTAWNHLRSVAMLVSLTAFIVGLVRMREGVS